MSLNKNVKKISEEKINIDYIRLGKIKKKFDNMDDEFWDSIVLQSNRFEENFKRSPSYQNILIIENWMRKVYKVETQYDGYEAILKEPARYDEIVENTRMKLLDVDYMVNQIMEIRKGIFALTNTEQIQLDA